MQNTTQAQDLIDSLNGKKQTYLEVEYSNEAQDLIDSCDSQQQGNSILLGDAKIVESNTSSMADVVSADTTLTPQQQVDNNISLICKNQAVKVQQKRGRPKKGKSSQTSRRVSSPLNVPAV